MKLNNHKAKIITHNKNNLINKITVICIISILLFTPSLTNVSYAAKNDKNVSDIEEEFLSSIDMVLDILEKDKDMSDYANTYKYIYYKYTNDEGYKTELDFSAYDVSGFSNVSSNGSYSAKNIPQAVLNLKSNFETAAAKYGIEDYVDVLLAICTQESHGSGNDVMQCGASSVAESIDTGTRIFSEHLKKSGGDLDIALQAYNYGGAYISYAKARGGYSKKNAIEFAKIHSGGKKHEPGNALGEWCYGDQNYVEHVKQYLNVSENGKSTDMLKNAKSLHEALEGNNASWSITNLPSYKNIRKSKYVCCANYVSAVLVDTGYISESKYTPSAAGLEGVLSNESKFIKISSFSKIKAGDIVFMTRPNEKSGIGHVQIYAGNNKWYNTGSTDAIRSASPRSSAASYVSKRFVCAYRYKE